MEWYNSNDSFRAWSWLYYELDFKYVYRHRKLSS